MANVVNFDQPLPGIHDAFSRLLVAELDRRLDHFRFVAAGGWLLNVYVLRPASRIIGYRVAQIGFMDDEIWFFLHLELLSEYQSLVLSRHGVRGIV